MKMRFGLVRLLIATGAACLIFSQFHSVPNDKKIFGVLVGILGFVLVILYKTCYLVDIVLVGFWLLLGFAYGTPIDDNYSRYNFDPCRASRNAAGYTMAFGLFGILFCLSLRYLLKDKYQYVSLLLICASFVFFPLLSVVLMYCLLQECNTNKLPISKSSEAAN